MRSRITSGLGLLALLLLAVASPAEAEQLVIAFTLDTPPYVMDRAAAGIEIDIVRTVLKAKGYTFTTQQMSYGKLADAVARKGVDAAATVIARDDGTYYSDPYITFRNFAITKKSAGLKIRTVADLKGKSIVAWQNAYQDLGTQFQTLFSPTVEEPYRKKYREIANQKQQVAMFWKGEAEVIVIDRSVMQWFSKELAGEVDTSAGLVYHKIFPDKTDFRISFKSKQVRDDFNAGLKKLRASGQYDKIYHHYLK